MFDLVLAKSSSHLDAYLRNNSELKYQLKTKEILTSQNDEYKSEYLDLLKSKSEELGKKAIPAPTLLKEAISEYLELDMDYLEENFFSKIYYPQFLKLEPTRQGSFLDTIKNEIGNPDFANELENWFIEERTICSHFRRSDRTLAEIAELNGLDFLQDNLKNLHKLIKNRSVITYKNNSQIAHSAVFKEKWNSDPEFRKDVMKKVENSSPDLAEFIDEQIRK